jgi:Lon protease-like protein
MNRTIPLFPLHTVFFPRTPLSLRIFEDRYLRMVARCKEQERPFGIVLIREGHEVGAPASPHGVGTLAQIRNIAPLGNDMIIEVEGTQRFRLLDYAVDAEPYLIGTAESIRDTPYDPAVVIPLATEVRRLFHGYFERLVRMAGQSVPHYQLPTESEDLSYVIAAVMQQAPLLSRQRLLETTDTRQRLETEKAMLQAELERIAGVDEDIDLGIAPLTADALRDYTSRN